MSVLKYCKDKRVDSKCIIIALELVNGLLEDKRIKREIIIFSESSLSDDMIDLCYNVYFLIQKLFIMVMTYVTISLVIIKQ